MSSITFNDVEDLIVNSGYYPVRNLVEFSDKDYTYQSYL